MQEEVRETIKGYKRSSRLHLGIALFEGFISAAAARTFALFLGADLPTDLKLFCLLVLGWETIYFGKDAIEEYKAKKLNDNAIKELSM